MLGFYEVVRIGGLAEFDGAAGVEHGGAFNDVVEHDVLGGGFGGLEDGFEDGVSGIGEDFRIVVFAAGDLAFDVGFEEEALFAQVKESVDGVKGYGEGADLDGGDFKGELGAEEGEQARVGLLEVGELESSNFG